MPITITDEMRNAAQEEALKRDPNIDHHFELDYMSGEQRDIVSFLGEFACKEYMGLDWKAGIRENYDTIDSGDIILPNAVIDIKTETIPFDILMDLVRGKISDDAPYGRRLINENQIPLLEHYNYIVWGAFARGSYSKWYCLGYLETEYILNNYKITSNTPFGKKYPTPCISVRHSELKNINRLISIIKKNI